MNSETVQEAASSPNGSSKSIDGAVIGCVVSNKMHKSVSVSIERLERHPVYGKFVRRTTKILAHDEANECKEGDTVAIVECRPISKRKAWRVVEIVKAAAAT
jgi:small subunit ribosomal protein S17